MCDTRWAIFSTEFMGAGWKNRADVMASNISHFWGGNSLQMEHILELRSLSGWRRTKSSRRLHKLHLISLLPLTTQPAEPEITTTMLMTCNITYFFFSCAQKPQLKVNCSQSVITSFHFTYHSTSETQVEPGGYLREKHARHTQKHGIKMGGGQESFTRSG